MQVIVEDGEQERVLLSCHTRSFYNASLKRSDLWHQNEEGHELQGVSQHPVGYGSLKWLWFDVERLTLHRDDDVQRNHAHYDRMHVHRKYVPCKDKETDDESLAHFRCALGLIRRSLLFDLSESESNGVLILFFGHVDFRLCLSLGRLLLIVSRGGSVRGRLRHRFVVVGDDIL